MNPSDKNKKNLTAIEKDHLMALLKDYRRILRRALGAVSPRVTLRRKSNNEAYSFHFIQSFIFLGDTYV